MIKSASNFYVRKEAQVFLVVVLFVCLFVCFLSLVYYLFNFKMSHLQCVLKMYFYRGFSGYSIYRSLHINKCTDYFRYLDGIT